MIWCIWQFDSAKSYLCRADYPVLCSVLTGNATFWSSVWVQFAVGRGGGEEDRERKTKK